MAKGRGGRVAEGMGVSPSSHRSTACVGVRARVAKGRDGGPADVVGERGGASLAQVNRRHVQLREVVARGERGVELLDGLDEEMGVERHVHGFEGETPAHRG